MWYFWFLSLFSNVFCFFLPWYTVVPRAGCWARIEVSSPVRQTARDTVPASRAASCQPTVDGMMIRAMMATMAMMGSNLHLRGCSFSCWSGLMANCHSPLFEYVWIPLKQQNNFTESRMVECHKFQIPTQETTDNPGDDMIHIYNIIYIYMSYIHIPRHGMTWGHCHLNFRWAPTSTNGSGDETQPLPAPCCNFH